MTTLSIHIDLYNLDAAQTPVTTEILDGDLEVHRRLVVRKSEQTDLEAGTYLVRATLPSGGVLSSAVTISPGQAEAQVTLKMHATPHEYLSWQSFLGGYRGPTPGGAPIKSPGAGSVHTPLDEPVWMRMWRLQSWRGGADHGGFLYASQSAWQVEPLDTWSALPKFDASTPEMFVVDLRPPSSSLAIRCLQVGGPDIPWRSICLPPSRDDLQVMLRPSSAGGELSGGLVVKVVTTDAETEALSHYALTGDFNASEGLADSVMRQAEDLFREKMIYPYGAMIGAYHLLMAGKLDRLHKWANNFANGVDWLPDSAVIHAWQLLYSGVEADRGLARERLLQAAQRGLPVMRKGMRLLVDGLNIYADMARANNQPDEAVEAALSYVRRYASALDWNQRLTTFYGETPTQPGLKPVRGNAPEALTRPESLLQMQVRL